jgi:TP901 family phage tail tape measure protein
MATANLFVKISTSMGQTDKAFRQLRSNIFGSTRAIKAFRDQAKMTGFALGATFTAPMVVLGKEAVKAVAKYELAMKLFQTTTKASGDDMAAVETGMKDLSKTTVGATFSQTEMAQVLLELGKAGFSAKDALAMLPSLLTLARAGDLEAADAATTLADTLSAFKLPATEAARVVDVLAGAALSSTAEINDVTMAASQASAAFAQAGIPVEDMATAISLMANAGIKGSDAGTALKTMVMRLIAPTQESAAWFAVMGVKLRDADGQLRPFGDIVKDTTSGLARLNPAQRDMALAAIFGTDAFRGAVNVLAQGADRWEASKKQVTEMGQAYEYATAKADTLQGKWDTLQAKLDDFETNAGKPHLETLKTWVDRLGGLIDKFQALPEPVQNATFAAAGFLGVVGPLSLAVAGLASAIASVGGPFVIAMSVFSAGAVIVWGLTGGFDEMRRVLGGPVTKALETAFGPVANLVGAFDSLQQFIRDVKDALNGQWNWPDWGAIWRGAFDLPEWLQKLLGLGKQGQLNTTSFGGSIPGYAQGGVVPGPIGAPMLATVHGGEYVVPAGGGRGGGTVVNVTVNGSLYGTDLEDLIVQAITRAERRGRL